jgi:NADH-quinone oxidoreductase subunit N
VIGAAQIWSVFGQLKEAAVLRFFAIISSLILVGVCIYSTPNSGTLFHGTYRVDLFSQMVKVGLSLCLLFTALFSNESFFIAEEKRPESFFFLCASTFGLMMMASAADILTLYIAMELSSYSLYTLTGFGRDRRAAEAGTKYLIFGAATSGFLLWGFSLMTGLAGSTSLAVIAQKAPQLVGQPAFVLALIFVSFSFLFKLSGFPMHFWAPDTYESASTPVTGFIATASKIAAVAILIRIFQWVGIPAAFVTILGALAFISMTLGNCVALVQQDVKRLLAYSSIAQAGYIVVGLLSGTFEGYSSALFYGLAYGLMNAAAFLVVIYVAKAARHDNPQISHFDGLAERSPFLALILLLSLLSLAGIPPLVGFSGKWILFSAAMNKGHWFLVLWGVLNSVVSLFYYLSLVKHAYLEKPKETGAIVMPLHMQLLGLFFFIGLVGLGVYPNVLIEWTREAVRFSALLP